MRDKRFIELSPGETDAILNAMTTDEMKEMRNLFGEADSIGLREKARPTFTRGPEGKTCKSCKYAVGQIGE